MATINSRVVFITTSPRTPHKMIPEINLLDQIFSGKPWSEENQIAFMECLSREDFFHGESSKNLALSARDRINRAPKALGFVRLAPMIELTPAGKALTRQRRKEEIFLRQLLKFQLPSPYHQLGDACAKFYVKPYLELFRLIRIFGSLRLDELWVFGLQLVDYRDFDAIVQKIINFRNRLAQNRQSYKKFFNQILYEEVQHIYAEDIASGHIKTRESKEVSVTKFLRTKARNMRDYADACIRYLRATGMVAISHIGKTVSIVPEKLAEVDYFLANVDRNPADIQDEEEYVQYIGDDSTPVLLTDDKMRLLDVFHKEFPSVTVDAQADVVALKDLLTELLESRKNTCLNQQIEEIKQKKMFDDIQHIFTQIVENAVYDAPLLLEWNVWRAMTMLDGGDITANLKFDDDGNPMSTAQGNMADIVCDYGTFGVTVEVTLQRGQRQYETEGEPVARHLAQYRKRLQKPAYCLFVAPEINQACIAHFYVLHRTSINFYGGESIIVPLPLSFFRRMLEDANLASYRPTPSQIERFFKLSHTIAHQSESELEWFDRMRKVASDWLNNQHYGG